MTNNDLPILDGEIIEDDAPGPHDDYQGNCSDYDPDPLAEDYPGQRVIGPDYDTRDKEGR